MTFFEKIALADLERIHSQVLSWIFSPDCESIPLEGKSKILTELFGLNSKKYSSINSITELMRIDILILADDDLFVIENKFKSTLSENQLEKYEKAISDYTGTFFNKKDVNTHYGYLTLISEGGNNENWKDIDYYTFNKLLSEVINLEHSSSPLLKEYSKTLDRITSACQDFIVNTSNYKRIFLDGSLKIDEKKAKISNGFYVGHDKVIAQNNLETILQRMYWNHMISNIQENAYVKETNGNAYVSVPFSQYNKLINGIEFNYKFEIQKTTVKINFVPMTMKDYNKSGKSWIDEEQRVKFRNSLSHTTYSRYNDGNTKAQVSITKPINHDFYEQNIESARNIFKNLIQEAEIIIKTHLF
jgi:PD-(D/E)XK nuclease superfamily protein